MNTNTLNNFEITINAYNLDYVKNKVNEFNTKAIKLNKKQIELSYMESYINTINDEVKELIDIRIKQYENIIIEGYQVVAKIDHTYPDKNFVTTYIDTTEAQLNKWEHISSNCQHCNTIRKRNITYILQNVNTKQYIQVGKSCLKDFLGYDIKNTLTYFDLLKELTFNIGNIKATKKIQFFKVIDILNLTQIEINKNGYVSSKEKYLHDIPTTGDRVKETILNTNNIAEITEANRIKLHEVISYITNYKIDNNEPENIKQFYNNLKHILKYDYCKIADIGILATTLKVYEVAREKEKINAENLISEHYGTIGNKIEIEVTLKNCKSYSTDFDQKYIYTFKKDNYTFTWNTTKALNIEVNSKILLTGKIKEYNNYKGLKQTVLTRCTVTSLEVSNDISLYTTNLKGYDINIKAFVNNNNRGTYMETKVNNNIIKYSIYSNSYVEDYEYKKGIKGIKKIKNDLSEIYKLLEQKLNINLHSWSRKQLRKLKVQDNE